MAEREGFEPSVPLAEHDDLANRCLRPLGHLSKKDNDANASNRPIHYQTHAFRVKQNLLVEPGNSSRRHKKTQGHGHFTVWRVAPHYRAHPLRLCVLVQGVVGRETVARKRKVASPSGREKRSSTVLPSFVVAVTVSGAARGCVPSRLCGAMA